jgi:TolB protein
LASILLLLGGGGGAFLFARMGGFGFSGPPTATDALPPAPPTDTPTATQTSTPTASATPTSTPSPAPIPSVTPTITKTPVTLGGGGRIAFASDRGEGRWLQIWTMNPDGSDPRQLTFGPGDKSQPRWSPNGQRLAFVSEADRNAEIYVMNANGEHLVNLTNHPSEDTGPAWSPDGTRMAFTTTRVAEVRQVFLMNLDCPSPSEPCSSSNPHNITVGYAVEYSPVWAPSGFEPPPWMPEDQPIAVSASINDAPGRLVFRSADGGEPVWFDLQDRLIGVDHLDWSEDGEFLLFTWKQPGVFEIYSVPIADRGNRWNKLTNSLGNQRPSFSPDGRWIVFMSTRDQNPEIYVMTVSGANQTNITEHTSRDIDPDWAPAPDD